VILGNAGMRNLVLFYVQHDMFKSAAPASFLRIGRSLSPDLGSTIKAPRMKRKYAANEVVTVILRSRIGSGATGVLYDSTLQVFTPGMGLLSEEIIVKLAFDQEQRSRMRHEYNIYRHLASSGVKGCIPRIYGLFEDMEDGATALLMNHVGKFPWNDEEEEEFKYPPLIRCDKVVSDHSLLSDVLR
jgi:hypothetical protein